MISFDEAIASIKSAARPLGVETVPLERAARRVLAEPVVAQIDSPRRDVSAMDGYAVREEDLAEFPARLNVVGQSFAGTRWRASVAKGECVRIFTGAPVPPRADRVVIQEIVKREGDIATISSHPGSACHIRKRGSDFSAGDELLSAGKFLNSRAIVAAAGADINRVQVYRRPRIHILSTGDELAAAGTARDSSDAIPDSVSLGVAALTQEWGAEFAGSTRLRDDLASMEPAAATAADSADVVVVVGGASVGERDFAKDMFARLGLQLLFSKVAIQPGKPAWLGRVSNCFVVGLPGNPTSAIVTARLFLVPLLTLMQGQQIADALCWKSARLGSGLGACAQRETFHRAVMEGEVAQILSFQDSSAQKALAEANILVRQRANSPSLGAGEMVEFVAL